MVVVVDNPLMVQWQEECKRGVLTDSELDELFDQAREHNDELLKGLSVEAANKSVVCDDLVEECRSKARSKNAIYKDAIKLYREVVGIHTKDDDGNIIQDIDGLVDRIRQLKKLCRGETK